MCPKESRSAAAAVIAEQAVADGRKGAVLAHAVQQGNDDGPPATAEDILQANVFVGEYEGKDQNPKAVVAGTTRIAVHYVKPPIWRGNPIGN